MDALNNLRKMYRLLSNLVKVYLVILLLAVIVGVAASLLAMFKS